MERKFHRYMMANDLLLSFIEENIIEPEELEPIIKEMMKITMKYIDKLEEK